MDIDINNFKIGALYTSVRFSKHHISVESFYCKICNSVFDVDWTKAICMLVDAYPDKNNDSLLLFMVADMVTQEPHFFEVYATSKLSTYFYEVVNANN